MSATFATRMHSIAAERRAQGFRDCTLLGSRASSTYGLDVGADPAVRVTGDTVAVRLPWSGDGVAYRRRVNTFARAFGLGFLLLRGRGRTTLSRTHAGSQVVLPGTWYVWNRRDGAVRLLIADAPSKGYDTDRVRVMAELEARTPRFRVIAASGRVAYRTDDLGAMRSLSRMRVYDARMMIEPPFSAAVLARLAVRGIVFG